MIISDRFFVLFFYLSLLVFFPQPPPPAKKKISIILLGVSFVMGSQFESLIASGEIVGEGDDDEGHDDSR